MVAHGHKAIEAAGGIQCHTNHDQQAGTAQLNAHTGQVAQNDRQYSHRSPEPLKKLFESFILFID